jgi:hypothetical protein
MCKNNSRYYKRKALQLFQMCRLFQFRDSPYLAAYLAETSTQKFHRYFSDGDLI